MTLQQAGKNLTFFSTSDFTSCSVHPCTSPMNCQHLVGSPKARSFWLEMSTLAVGDGAGEKAIAATEKVRSNNAGSADTMLAKLLSLLSPELVPDLSFCSCSEICSWLLHELEVFGCLCRLSSALKIYSFCERERGGEGVTWNKRNSCFAQFKEDELQETCINFALKCTNQCQMNHNVTNR